MRIFQILTIFGEILGNLADLTLAKTAEFAFRVGFPELVGLLTRGVAAILMLGTVEEFVCP